MVLRTMGSDIAYYRIRGLMVRLFFQQKQR